MSRVFVCFFFKQKTAYEMRISDWSSDVCSSDLDGADADPADLAETLFARLIGDRNHIPRLDRPVHQQDQSGDQVAESLLQAKADEIGRASCRERVCQYV